MCYAGVLMTKHEKQELTTASKSPLFWVLVVAAATLVVSSFFTRTA